MKLDAATNAIRVADDLVIPLREIRYRHSRSSGPGGQNVNKVNTRVTLLFDINTSAALNEFQRRRIMQRLKTRITRDGVLRVVAVRHRTQAANRRAALHRFATLLADALAHAKPRKKTAVPRFAHEQRLRDKARRSKTKRARAESAALED